MNLTPAQRATLVVAIKANQAANTAYLAGDTFGLLAWCNGASATLAWNESVSIQTSDEAATYTAYDTLAAGKRDSWAIFLKFARDFSKSKVRSWVIDVWGADVVSSISAAILTAGTVTATNAQAALGGGTTGSGFTTALKRNFSLLVDQQDANAIVNNVVT